MATLRTHGERERSLEENRKRVDTENRTHWLTVTNQWWLGIWLVVHHLCATGVRLVDLPERRGRERPQQRRAHLSSCSQEAPHELPSRKPKAPWPADGQIEIKDVVLKYKPDLPPVLRGLSMSAKPGENIGIIGQ